MEQIVLEINPRTKEKITKDLMECILFDDYKVKDLVANNETLIIEVAKLQQLTNKLIDVITNLNKSMQVQIADIKEEIK